MPITSAAAPPIANAFIAVMRDSEISLFENMPPLPLAGASSAACAPVRSIDRLVVLEHRDRLAHGLAVGERSLEDVVALGHAVDRDAARCRRSGPRGRCYTLSPAGALTLTRPRSEPDDGPKCTRPNVSGVGGTSLGSAGAASDDAGAAAAAHLRRRFLLGEGRRRDQQRQRDDESERNSCVSGGRARKSAA